MVTGAVAADPKRRLLMPSTTSSVVLRFPAPVELNTTLLMPPGSCNVSVPPETSVAQFVLAALPAVQEPLTSPFQNALPGIELPPTETIRSVAVELLKSYI